jgi:HD-GYP domain-containing protein (c-di-GMP phosphodiesterase class II)
MNEEALKHVWRGALLHDIGILGIPDSILKKPGRLDEAEWQIVREHPEHAYKWFSVIEFLQPALDIPYCHHEKWDGSGYPRGLKGLDIPLAARLFAIVDVWDALNSDRPYRPALSMPESRKYIEEQSGKHFDPEVVRLFLEKIYIG